MSSQDQTTISQGQGIDEALQTKNAFLTLQGDAATAPFAEAAKNGGLMGVLAGPDLVTVFVPPGPVDQPEKYVVVRRMLKAIDLKLAGSVKALDNSNVQVKWRDGEGFFGDVRIARADIACTNGIIHILERA